MVAEHLPRMDVRQMHLNGGNCDSRYCIANGHAGVGIGAGIYENPTRPLSGRMDFVNQTTFVIRLKRVYFNALDSRHRRHSPVDGRQRIATIDARLSDAKEIQVRAVQDKDFHSTASLPFVKDKFDNLTTR